MKLYDITQPLTNGSAPWPGDTPYSFELTWRMDQGAPVNVSRIALSPHNGTHADAPYHYDGAGLTMEQVPLERYIGPARLIAIENRCSIGVDDLRGLDLTGVTRLLIRTGSCPDYPSRFNPDFTWFEPAAVTYLAGLGVQLIGTDAHSMDPCDSKDLPAHRACAQAGLLILENLKLTQVPVGDYELIALPLRLTGADGSPVRAVLRAGA